ncbi:hypothetical protein [Sphingomonas sp. TREG-RG-20F-R18-01]|uniref:hypothetical protein n=1 Tax=Sphingomonas sp. TREG-RG-20F-R18-01 TaxID=2914982 RepID=UPI001F56B3CC|nr:hypothetical protein [Sphingomonas sp. TREG-RG-20F-R18-01]
MFTRISSLVLSALLLAGCGEREGDHTVRAQQNAELPTVFCAHGGTSQLVRACTIERMQTQSGVVLTLRHADGAFRRLLVTHDGRGVIAADGAQQAVVRVLGAGEVEVGVGGDRYRLPEAVRGVPSIP